MEQNTISVFDFNKHELELFKKRYFREDITFDFIWEDSINIVRQDNLNNPAIDQVIGMVYNDNTKTVGRDVFQIMIWREELLREELKQLKEKLHEKENCKEERSSKEESGEN